MSLNGSFLSEEQFMCSICLDVFTNPSSTPCGHSFCMTCISRYWDGSKVYQCPLCKKTFQKRPDLQINRTLREITDQFKSMNGGFVVGKNKKGGKGGRGARSGHLIEELKRMLPKPLAKENVNLTIEEDSQALLASSVPDTTVAGSLNNTFAHPPLVRPRHCSNGLRRFTLSGAATSQHVPLCETHLRGLVLYCRSDQMCICPECEVEDHNDHDTVSVETEWMETKECRGSHTAARNLEQASTSETAFQPQLRISEEEIQEMIRERTRKIDEIKTSVTEVEMAVERETSGSVRFFSKLVSAIERSQAELMEVMEMSRRAAHNHADAMIRQLEQEIEELQQRETALAELAQSDDHIYCVQTFPGLSRPPVTKDWSGVTLNPDLGTATIYRSLSAMLEKFQDELKNVVENGFPATVLDTSPIRLQPRAKKIQAYALNVSLDTNTAHPRLVLSEDLKTVWCADRHHHVPDSPERFDRVVCVLGREAISSGKHYWEVEVNGKTDWDLGVARQSVNRKGKIDYTPNNGFWFLSLRDKNKYAFRTEPYTDVELNLRPHKIGIFVDYEKGEVSFYNVDSKVHIYSFHDVFTENIYPFFSPCTNKSGKNDMPLIITPVYKTN